MSSGGPATAPFDLVAVTTSLELGPQRRGTAAFSATNRTGRTVRARAMTVALEETASNWLHLADEAERGFAPDATHEYEVGIEVPADAAAGIYPFRLDVVGVDEPGLQARGPTVAFAVGSERPPSGPTRKRGYLATVAGALAGSAAGAGAGLVPGAVFALAQVGRTDLRTAVAIAGLGALLGAWAGAAGGGWLGLRLQSHARSDTTGLLLAGLCLLPFGAALAHVLVSAPALQSGLLAAGLLVGVVAAAAASRAIALRLTWPERPREGGA